MNIRYVFLALGMGWLANTHAAGFAVDSVVPIDSQRVRNLALPTLVYQAEDLEQRLPNPLRQALAASMHSLLEETELRGASAALLIPGSGVWTWSTGSADPDIDEPLQPDHRLHAGSIGKVATATLIWQLIETGQLTLAQTIAEFFPQWPQVAEVTIEQLLHHTSGIYSFNWASEVRTSKRAFSPQELLDIAFAKPLLFEPGTQWSYSNTNYLMLALIAEQLTQTDYRELLQQQLIQPLRLTQTSVLYPTPGQRVLASPHQPTGHHPHEVVQTHVAVPHGAGTLASTPHDLVKWFYQLLSARSISRASLQHITAEMFPMSHQDGIYAGLGLLRIDSPLGPWLYHSGGIGQYKAFVAYSPGQQAFVAAMSNAGEPVEALVLRIMQVTAEYQTELRNPDRRKEDTTQ